MRTLPRPRACRPSFALFAPALFLVTAADSPTRAAGDAPPTPVTSHALSVTLDPSQRRLEGTARLTLEPGLRHATVALGTTYAITAAQLEQGGSARALALPKPRLRPAGPDGAVAQLWSFELGGNTMGTQPPVLSITWSGPPPALPQDVKFSREEIAGMPDGYLAPEGAFLTPSAGWYPTGTQERSLFTLEARVPAAWRVVSEGRRDPAGEQAQGEWRVERYDATHPVEGIHLVAAPWKVQQLESEGQRLAVYTLPDTPEDLGRNYLAAVQSSLERYSKQIGAHAWPQFVVAEHILPTGYGMPSFTLLGAGVMRLPFILRTSLPHEVLHDWWGNGVYVDETQGNWCEGLTAYLADHALAGEDTPGGDVEYRRQILRDYAEYVTGAGAGSERAVSEFRERHDRATRSLGYGKVAMIFRMLEVRLGPERFQEALRTLYAEKKYQRAGWSDIEGVFSRVAKENLSGFFKQWVQRPGAPSLTLERVETKLAGDQYRTEVAVKVPGGWQIPVPVDLFGAEGQRARGIAQATGGSAVATIVTPFAPQRVEVDAEIDLFRLLRPAEIPPTLARLLAAPPDLVVVGTGRGEGFVEAGRSAANQLAQGKAPVRLDHDVSGAQLQAASRVWLIGRPGSSFAALLAGRLPEGTLLGEDAITVARTVASGPDAAAVLVIDHPAPGKGALGIVDAVKPEGLVFTARRLTHYGKYSYLLFSGNQATVKQIAPPAETPLVRLIAPPAAK
ncbi:MAG: hypothetical protein MUC67_01600 [Acidobacteria bacterium]|nr:hypothetical protein [Acidobacteriota bacterium]